MIPICELKDYKMSSWDNQWKPWLLAFSSYSNGLQLQSTSSKGVAFPALHGIRTMAMSMVVLANVYKHAMLSRINDNTTVFLKRYLFTIISCSLTFARPGDVALYMLYLAALTLNNKTGMKFLALIWLSDWGHIWLTSRGVGLEVFMVMSGLLVSFYFLEERSKDRHFSLKLYVLRHYLRLTPVFAAMVLIHATLLSRLGTSPRWHHHAVLEEKNCQDDWWKMLLYIHNWWDSKPNECLEQTWFLAANMQLYLLSPLILLPLAWRPKVGLVILSLLLLGGHVTIFCISYLNQVKVDYLRNFNERWTSQFFKATYTRCTSWMTGLALGYFLYLKKQNGYNFNSVALNEKHTFIKKVGLLLIWILALVLCLLPMFMVHPFIQEDYNYKALESAIYLTFARSSFCFGVTIIMALCVLGHGGAINKFLSRGYKFPISRLSFAIYMVHMTVVELLFYDARTSYHASDLLMVQDVLYVLGYSILFAILMTFLFEMPIINLQYLLFDSGKSKRCSHNNSVVLNHEDSPTVQMTEGGLNIASKQ